MTIKTLQISIHLGGFINYSLKFYKHFLKYLISGQQVARETNTTDAFRSNIMPGFALQQNGLNEQT